MILLLESVDTSSSYPIALIVVSIFAVFAIMVCFGLFLRLKGNATEEPINQEINPRTDSGAAVELVDLRHDSFSDLTASQANEAKVTIQARTELFEADTKRIQAERANLQERLRDRGGIPESLEEMRIYREKLKELTAINNSEIDYIDSCNRLEFKIGEREARYRREEEQSRVFFIKAGESDEASAAMRAILSRLRYPVLTIPDIDLSARAVIRDLESEIGTQPSAEKSEEIAQVGKAAQLLREMARAGSLVTPGPPPPVARSSPRPK